MKTARDAIACSYWKNSRALLHPAGQGGLNALECLALIAASFVEANPAAVPDGMFRDVTCEEVQ